MYSTQLLATFFALAVIGWATLTQGAIIVARRDVCDNYECALSLRFSVVVTLILRSSYAIAKTGDTVCMSNLVRPIVLLLIWAAGTIYDDDCDRKLVLDTDAPCDEGSFSCGTGSSASSPNITALHSTTVNNNQTYVLSTP